jgi:hypothetical protein
MKEFMNMHSQKLFGLLGGIAKKREQKEMQKLLEQKEAVYNDNIKSTEFNNDMFDNIKINKKPSEGSMIITVKNDVMPINQCLNENINGDNQIPMSGYSHHDIYDAKAKKNGYEAPANNCHNSYQQSYAELRPEAFVGSNHN